MFARRSCGHSSSRMLPRSMPSSWSVALKSKDFFEFINLIYCTSLGCHHADIDKRRGRGAIKAHYCLLATTRTISCNSIYHPSFNGISTRANNIQKRTRIGNPSWDKRMWQLLILVVARIGIDLSPYFIDVGNTLLKSTSLAWNFHTLLLPSPSLSAVLSLSRS